MNLVVFTDLDGTLLGHDDYSYEAARDGIERIRQQQIPLIFTSSKTRLEIEALQAAMQIREPFIAENGAAIFFPDDYRNFKIDAGFRRPPYTVIQRGATYSEIRRFVYSVKERFNLKGFGDLRVEEIELLTGLSPEKAALARQREFSEPFLIEDDIDLFNLVKADHPGSRGWNDAILNVLRNLALACSNPAAPDHPRRLRDEIGGSHQSAPAGGGCRFS